jgi:hypothetical protein
MDGAHEFSSLCGSAKLVDDEGRVTLLERLSDGL